MDDKSEKRKRRDLFLASLHQDEAWMIRYPPILTVELAASLLHQSKHTIYGWSSRGVLGNCKQRAGNRVLILRDCYVDKFLNGEFDGKTERRGKPQE